MTFGLLVARSRDISLSDGIEHAAQELRKSNSLIGTALRLLTDDVTNQEALKTSLGTLTRVLDAVNWHTISKDKPEAWLYFYEDFLEVYDNKLRKRTGSYYTPPEVVSAMVNLVDEALRGPLFERPTASLRRMCRRRSGGRHRHVPARRVFAVSRRLSRTIRARAPSVARSRRRRSASSASKSSSVRSRSRSFG